MTFLNPESQEQVDMHSRPSFLAFIKVFMFVLSSFSFSLSFSADESLFSLSSSYRAILYSLGLPVGKFDIWKDACRSVGTLVFQDIVIRRSNTISIRVISGLCDPYG